MTPPDVFAKVLELVCNVFDSYSAVLFLPDPADSGCCRLTASFSLGDNVRQGMTLTPGQGLTGWIIREGKPLLISDFDRKRGVLGYYSGRAESAIRAFLGVPLTGVAGALCLDSKKVHGFGDKDQKILSEFARLVSALYLERNQLAAGQAETRLSQSLYRISDLPRRHPKWSAYLREFLSEISTAAGFGRCFLAVRNDAANVFIIEGANQAILPPPAPDSFPLGGGMIGWVFKNDAPVYAESADTTPLRLFGVPADGLVFKNVICQPVSFSRRVWAVLVLAGLAETALSDARKQFVRASAGQMALFLETLHLRGRLAKRER